MNKLKQSKKKSSPTPYDYYGAVTSFGDDPGLRFPTPWNGFARTDGQPLSIMIARTGGLVWVTDGVPAAETLVCGCSRTEQTGEMEWDPRVI